MTGQLDTVLVGHVRNAKPLGVRVYAGAWSVVAFAGLVWAVVLAMQPNGDGDDMGKAFAVMLIGMPSVIVGAIAAALLLARTRSWQQTWVVTLAVATTMVLPPFFPLTIGAGILAWRTVRRDEQPNTPT